MAKVFLTTAATGYVVANTDDFVYGSTGTESISIADAKTGIIVDANTETVALVSAISTYHFKQTGNVLSVYLASDDTTLISTMAIDDNGSTLIMNSVSYAAAISGGVMTLGGATVSTTVGAIVPAVSGTAADLAANSAALVTAVANPTVTITGTTAATVAELVAINAATSSAITLNAETIAADLSGTAADLVLAFAGTVTEHTGTIAITGGTVSAANLDTIANETTGAVTASIAVDTAISDATVSALSHVDANDVITLASTVVTADATALNDLNTLADTKSYANLATITELAAEIGGSAVEITNALAIKAGAAVTITNAISAADLDTIANATAGIVTASIAVDTAISDATVSALSHVDANDVITLASTVVTADATALNDLNALADTKSYANLATITELAAEIGGSAVEITNALAIKAGAAVTIAGGTILLADYNTIDTATSGVITAAVAATGGTDTFVLNNNILAIGTGTTFLNTTDQLSFVGMTDNGGTLAKLDITNDDTGTDGVTLDSTNSTVYCIDTDATDLSAGTTAKTIADFTVMADVAAFLSEGFVTASSTGKVDYFVINDGSDATKAYIYKFVDTAGDTVLNTDGTGLTLIGSVTHDATATAASSIAIA